MKNKQNISKSKRIFQQNLFFVDSRSRHNFTDIAVRLGQFRVLTETDRSLKRFNQKEKEKLFERKNEIYALILNYQLSCVFVFKL